MEKIKDPLHGVTLEMMLNFLVKHRGWEAMAERVEVRCFQHDPSIKSSLHFLRRTPWARQKVETLYLKTVREETRKNLNKSQEGASLDKCDGPDAQEKGVDDGGRKSRG